MAPTKAWTSNIFESIRQSCQCFPIVDENDAVVMHEVDQEYGNHSRELNSLVARISTIIGLFVREAWV